MILLWGWAGAFSAVCAIKASGSWTGGLITICVYVVIYWYVDRGFASKK